MRVKFGRAAAVVLAVSAVAVAFVGGGAWGANPFTDIPGNSHANNIDAIFNAGITLGCSTTDPTRYCPADLVRRDQMASFLARLGGLNGGTSKNFPRANARSDMQSFCSAVKLSPQSFADGPCQELSTALDIDGTNNPSVTLDVDGQPIVSYFDTTAGDLKLARCATPSCSTAITRTVVSAANVGAHSAIRLGPDGIPLIAYYNTTDTDLYLARCGDIACNSATSTPIAVGANDFGTFPSIGIGGDGYPSFSFYNATNKFFQYAHCRNLNCTGTIDQRVLGSTGSIGGAMTIGSDGRPAVAFIDTGDDLRMFRCTTFDCASTTPFVNVDDSGTLDGEVSITIGSDGLPVVAYHDGLSLKVAHCTTSDCAASTIVTAVAGANGPGAATFAGEAKAIAVGINGLPVIAFTIRDSVANSPRIHVLRCRDVACASTASTPGPFASTDPSLVISPSGHALVAFRNTDSGLGGFRVKAYREVVS